MRPWPLAMILALAVLGSGCLVVNGPIAHMLFGTGGGRPADSVLEARIQLPPGFHIEVFAEGLRARTLRFTERGDLLVSTPRDGAVVLLAPDRDGDWRSDAERVLLHDLDRPYGIDLHEDWLYVAEADSVGRIGFDAVTGLTRGPYERIIQGLPSGGNHWTRTLRVGPDALLYLTLGSSCNVCEEKDPRRAAMLRYQLDGSGEELFATGLRNAVGFDWHPDTNELYATDNGRDMLGDDFPPCELNRVTAGGFYGWPYANGDRRPDPDFGPGQEARIERSLPPVHDFRAHNAPLGIHFVRGAHAPEAYRGAALVALHGSWNRSEMDGYRVVSLHWQPDGSIVERDFATGFLHEESIIGRPVDVAVGPDGAFYVSDDYAQVVYRIAKEFPPRSRQSTAPSLRRPGGEAQPAPAATSSAAAARGATLYETHRCYSCHDTARADPGVVPLDYRLALRNHDVESLRGFLAAPTPPMPANSLSEAERRDLAIYLLREGP